MPGQRTCSFCGKAEDAVDRLFEGPRAFICDECVKLCIEIFTEHKPSGRPRQNRKETLVCSFCGKTEDDVDLLIAGPTVFICDGCGRRFDEDMQAVRRLAP